MNHRPTSRLLWIASLATVWCLGFAGVTHAAPQELGSVAKSNATLVKLPLPLNADAEARVLSALESIAGRAIGAERPLVVLDFSSPSASSAGSTAAERLGRGTSFERALGIARWLSGPRGNRIRSIAYVPESIAGHAVLVALACEEIAMHPAAEMGLAGIDEPQTESTILQAYQEIAARRGLVPSAAVRSMLDPSETLVRLDLQGGGAEYVTTPELENRLRPENAWNETQLVPTNQMGTFTGQELRSWRWITHLVPDRELLTSILKLDRELKEISAFPEPRVAMRSHVRGIMNARQVDRTIRAIEDAMENEKANLLLIDLSSPGGNLAESLRLAFHLASIPNEKAEVVVFVSGPARGDAALIALAADSLFVAPDAMLGGAGEASISTADVESRKENLLEFSKLTSRFPGDVAGSLCPEMQIFDFRAANGRHLRAPAGWIEDDPKLPLWTQGDRIDYASGLNAAAAVEMGIAVDQQPNLAAVAGTYGLESLPEEKQTNTTEQIVEWIAAQRWLSLFLFMVGLMSLVAELNAPGLGVPGAIAAICFLLFFWLNLFQGTVEWLEILLILGGVACLAIEIFVLPGFGVFGIVGLLMLVLGLLLAGQTFVFPTNAYQTERVIYGLGQMGFGVLVFLGLLIGFRKQLANLPMLRWLALPPPSSDRFVRSMEHLTEERRSLIGKYGATMTPCNPHGKALIGDQRVDVVSEYGWIDEEIPIEVVRVEDMHVVVRRRTI